MNYKIVLTIGERIVGVIEVDPNEAMIDRDVRDRSQVENDYLSRTAFEYFSKELSIKPLTIPSTLPTEQAMPMMLGGDFGGISIE